MCLWVWDKKNGRKFKVHERIKLRDQKIKRSTILMFMKFWKESKCKIVQYLVYLYDTKYTKPL